MLLYVFFRFLHFVAIFGVAAAVVIENIAVKPSISKEDAIKSTKRAADEFTLPNIAVKIMIAGVIYM